jgi:hypothetical protein
MVHVYLTRNSSGYLALVEGMELSGSEPGASLQRLELLGLVAALSHITIPSKVKVHTNSAYLRKTPGKLARNQDLWEKINYLKQLHEIIFAAYEEPKEGESKSVPIVIADKAQTRTTGLVAMVENTITNMKEIQEESTPEFRVPEEIQTRVRFPWPGGKFVPQDHVRPHEVSDMLEYDAPGKFAWVRWTTDSQLQFQEVVAGGVWADGQILAGKELTVLFAYWADNQGKIYLVDDPNVTLESLGFITDMKAWNEAPKVGKRFNRTFAPLQVGTRLITGKPIDEVQEGKGFREAIYRLDIGEDLIVQFREAESEFQKHICDGTIDYSPEGARKLGITGPGTETINTPEGQAKGLSRIRKEQEPDIIVWFAKKDLKFKEFRFGRLGDLHPGMPATDLQSIINFRLERLLWREDVTGKIRGLAKDYMAWVYKTVHDERQLKKAVLAFTKDLATFKLQDSTLAMDQTEFDAMTAANEEGYILRKAGLRNVSFMSMPILYRFAYRHLLKKVMQCRFGRIPMEWGVNEGIAKRLYLYGDPMMIAPNGDFTPEKSYLREKDMPNGSKILEVCAPDIKEGLIVLWRQPNGHGNEFTIAWNKHVPELMTYKGLGMFFVGWGKQAFDARHGGADNDDAFIIVHDRDWVDHFANLSVYPVTGPLEQEEVDWEDRLAEAYDKAVDWFSFDGPEKYPMDQVKNYGLLHAMKQVELASNSGAGIGRVVLAGYTDSVCSLPEYREPVAAWIQENHGDWWADTFKYRPPFQMARLLTNLELVIDGNIKDPEQLKKLGDVSGFISNFHWNQQFYPEFLANRQRMPRTKIIQPNWIAVHTPIDEVFDRIAEMQAQLEDIFRNNEWLLVKPVPRDIQKLVKPTKEVYDLVHGIRTPGTETEEDLWDFEGVNVIWRKEWTQILQGDRLDPDHGRDEQKRIRGLVEEVLVDHKDKLMEVAHLLLTETYRQRKAGAPLTRTGQRRSYSDAKFGIDSITKGLFDLIDYCQLGGKSVAVNYFTHSSMLTQAQARVKVEANVVSRLSDDRILGLASCPDGEYVMSGGLIEVAQPHPWFGAPEEGTLPFDIKEAASLI